MDTQHNDIAKSILNVIMDKTECCSEDRIISDIREKVKEVIWLLAALPSATTPPTPVIRTAEEIEQMAYEIYPHDVPMESPGDQCKNYHYRQAYISGFQKAMELLRTQPGEREERVRAHSEAWDAAMDYVKEREDYQYGKRGGFVAPNKAQYLASIK